MQKYEYAVVFTTTESKKEPFQIDIYVARPEDKQSVKQEGKGLLQIFNELGKEGWELVDSLAVGYNLMFREYFFRRVTY